MKRRGTWKFCFRRTKAERVSERSKILLWDAAIAKKTQDRYCVGLSRLLPLLVSVSSTSEIDDVVADWVQKCWEDGESLHIGNDGLCGLHHYHPWTKAMVSTAWKLFKVRRRVEAPNRAPPLTAQIVHAMAMYALDHNNWVFAGLLLLGFFALLRTGELLHVWPTDLLITDSVGIISLKQTKTGLRNAAHETVSFDDNSTLEILRALNRLENFWGKCKRSNLAAISSIIQKWVLYHHCKRFDMQGFALRPYSLRRGGATHLFQTGSMERALIKGRWNSSKVAKIYLRDGLSHLPGMTFSPKARGML